MLRLDQSTTLLPSSFTAKICTRSGPSVRARFMEAAVTTKIASVPAA
jgi:hypothetical protein